MGECVCLCEGVCLHLGGVYWPSDSKGGGQRRSDPNSQERRSEFPFSATPSIVFLFNERWAIGPGWGREEGRTRTLEPSASSLTAGMDGREGRGWWAEHGRRHDPDRVTSCMEGERGTREVGMIQHSCRSAHSSNTLPCFSRIRGFAKNKQNRTNGATTCRIYAHECVHLGKSVCPRYINNPGRVLKYAHKKRWPALSRLPVCF